MFTFNNSYPFENRYRTFRILNYGKPYSNYKTYNIQHHPENKTNILAIYVDNQPCNTTQNNKTKSRAITETTSLLQNNLQSTLHTVTKYFVEIHYTPEQNKDKLDYIMTESDISELLSLYDFGIKL
jgi:hypothetical protein